MRAPGCCTKCFHIYKQLNEHTPSAAVPVSTLIMLNQVFCLAWLLAATSTARIGAEESNTDHSQSTHHSEQTADSSGRSPIDFIPEGPYGHLQKPSTLHKDDKNWHITDIYRPDYIRPEYILDYRVTGLKGRPLKTLPWGPVVLLPQQVPKTRLAVPPGFRKPEQEHDTDTEEKNLPGTAEYSKDYHHETLSPIVPLIYRVVVPHHLESNYKDRGDVAGDKHDKVHHIQDFPENHPIAPGYFDRSNRDYVYYYYIPKINSRKNTNRPTFHTLESMFRRQQHMPDKHDN